MDMYMIEDQVGAASHIVYARKDDKVNVIDTSRDLYLVECKEQRFFVWPHKMTHVEPGEKMEIQPEKKEGPKKITWLPKSSEQQNLFGSPIQGSIKKKKKK